MGIMLDQLGLAPGQRVLEIGAGTGYNAALVAHAVGAGGAAGEVVSVDIDDDVVAGAREHLAAAGFPHATVVCADGAEGDAARAPYDRVIATVGVWDLAPAWLDQLAPSGRLVVPLDLRGVQRSVAFEREGEGHWVSRSVVPCGFMRLRGPAAGPEQFRLLDRESELVLITSGECPIDGTVLATLATRPVATLATGVDAASRQRFNGFALWFAVSEPRACALSEVDPGTALGRVPIRLGPYRMTAGLAAGAGLAVLARSGDDTLTAVGYGPGGERRAAELAGHLRGWAAAGRPTSDGLRIDAYRLPAVADDTAGTQQAAGRVVEKRHTRLVLSWP
jgi:protein-L-isoaspartate(D-aspartate) O-methyltransferase